MYIFICFNSFTFVSLRNPQLFWPIRGHKDLVAMGSARAYLADVRRIVLKYSRFSRRENAAVVFFFSQIRTSVSSDVGVTSAATGAQYQYGVSKKFPCLRRSFSSWRRRALLLLCIAGKKKIRIILRCHRRRHDIFPIYRRYVEKIQNATNLRYPPAPPNSRWGGPLPEANCFGQLQREFLLISVQIGFPSFFFVFCADSTS